jgi:hypothetical protein
MFVSFYIYSCVIILFWILCVHVCMCVGVLSSVMCVCVYMFTRIKP